MNAKRRLSSRKPSVHAPALDRHAGSAGFTLVEILVVIVIIGILMALAVPAIFSAVSTANSTAMKMELNSLDTAVQKYQEKYGDYPPDFSDWAVVERHYRKIFPRISSDLALLEASLQTGGVHDPSKLNRGEVLVFVLGGYSSDPLRPFTGPGGPWEQCSSGPNPYQYNTSRENSFYDFDPTRLDIVALPLAGEDPLPGFSVRYMSSDNVDVDIFPSYAASSKNRTPFVYFDARTYDTHTPRGYNGFDFPEMGSVRPYISQQRDQGTTPSWNFMKPSSFQIIAPGIDGNFGFFNKVRNPSSTWGYFGGSSAGNPNAETGVYYQYPTGKATYTYWDGIKTTWGPLGIDNLPTVFPGKPGSWWTQGISRYQEPTSANRVDNFQQDNLTNFADGKLIDELQE